MKIGSATMAEVRSLVEKQGTLENVGTNQAAGGRFLRGKGNGLGTDDEPIMRAALRDQLAAL